MAGQDANTKALWHFNGADASTTFTDSVTRHTLSAVGDAQIDTGRTDAFGGNSGVLLLDGTGDYARDITNDANSEDYNIYASTSSNITLDFWVQLDAHAATSGLLQFTGGNIYQWQLKNIHGTGLRFYCQESASTIIDFTGAAGEITDSNWHHIALIKIARDNGLFRDGVQVAYEQSLDDTFGDYTMGFYVGTEIDNGTPTGLSDGAFDEIRFHNENYFGVTAVALQAGTATFTPPSSEYSEASTGAVGAMSPNSFYWGGV